MVEGNFLDLNDSGIENPVAVSLEKARYLNIKKGDILRVRFNDINGQSQAARLNVVAIFKPANSFMSMPIFLEVANLKKLAGYGPHDIGQLYLRIKDAKKFAAKDADKLHDAMQSQTAVLYGDMASKTKSAKASVLGFKSDSVSHKLLIKSLAFVSGDTGAAFGKDGVAIAEPLATQLAVKVGDSCAISYTAKYEPHVVQVKYPVRAVFRPSNGMRGNVLLVNEKSFYTAFYGNWPRDEHLTPDAYFPHINDPLYGAFDPEWLLLKRAHSTDEARKQVRDIASTKFKGAVVDVESMYEMASDVLKLESALNLITFGAVLVLFFIILIGVINTLRMTIRERTREIGTIRAIGMQTKDVRNSFILETMFLGLFSAVMGTALAFLAMFGLSRIIFNAEDNPLSMLLVNSHLNFVPSLGTTVFYIALIVAIAVATAYFPARRAAKMSAADALRHFE
jgi:ABC-type lipoprotein release transport system permease subunit